MLCRTDRVLTKTKTENRCIQTSLGDVTNKGKVSYTISWSYRAYSKAIKLTAKWKLPFPCKTASFPPKILASFTTVTLLIMKTDDTIPNKNNRNKFEYILCSQRGEVYKFAARVDCTARQKLELRIFLQISWVSAVDVIQFRRQGAF